MSIGWSTRRDHPMAIYLKIVFENLPLYLHHLGVFRSAPVGKFAALPGMNFAIFRDDFPLRGVHSIDDDCNVRLFSGRILVFHNFDDT